MSANESERLRYRNSAEYRAQKIKSVADRHALNKTDPDYRRLVQLRKDLHRVRDSYHARLEHASRLSKRLLKIARELLAAQKLWNAKTGKRAQ